MEQSQIFKVRDLRKKNQFKIDDAYLNGYARICRPVATAIYNSLCRHAEFNSQRAFPSQELMAYQHDISVSTVKRALKKLIEYNIILIEIEKKNGKFANNVYVLLDKSEWKKIPTVVHQRPTVHRRSPVTGGQITTTVKWTTKDNKDIKDNKEIIKDNKEYINTSQKLRGKDGLLKPLKRKDFKVGREVYDRILTSYQQEKGIELKGAEFGEPTRAIKTMFYSGRTEEQITDFMRWMKDVCDGLESDDKDHIKHYSWLGNWTILTVRRKMAEFLSGKLFKIGTELENQLADKYKMLNFNPYG